MLKPDTVLHRVPDLLVEIDTSNLVRISHGGRVLKFGPEALTLLDVCHTPCTVTEALRLAGTRLRGRRAAEQIVQTITAMTNGGVLSLSPHTGFSELPFPMGGYDAAFVHLTILNDTARKGAFVRAVRETVRPDDVVLDLGTGSGILAVAAAQAGARHVYAVEPAGMVHLAEQVARRNGVADRITFLRGWSTQLRLPEPATLLTTDIVGNEALDMVIWETVQDARERLLTPDARLLPSRLQGWARLVEVPPDVLARHRVDEGQVATWRAAYGIDFGPLAEGEADRPVGFYERPEVAREWPVLGAQTPLYEASLYDAMTPIDVELALPADRAGVATGVIVYFDATLSETVSFSSSPWHGGENSHWYTAVWALPEPVRVDTGSTVPVAYRYLGEGRSRLTSARSERSKG
jgi:protein arginine N-methyltransferase 1